MKSFEEKSEEIVKSKQQSSNDEPKTVERDESCVKARIKRYSTCSSSERQLSSDSRSTIIEYISDKLKSRSNNKSEKTKKQAALIKQLLEQQKIKQIITNMTSSSSQGSKQDNDINNDDHSSENFDQSMKYIEEKIRENRK